MKKNSVTIILSAIFCSVILFAGCNALLPPSETGKKDTTTEDMESPAKPSKDEPKQSPKPVVNDKALIEQVKKAIDKEYLMELPFDVSDVKVDWKEKSDCDYAGSYTATLKAKEALYHEIPNREGLKKLIEKDYEGELKTARDKASKQLKEPVKTTILNRYPTDDLGRLDFYEIFQAKGSELKIRGAVSLTRDDVEEPFEITRLSKRTNIESGIPEDELPRSAHRVDDEETQEKVAEIVKKRKEWIANVDDAIQNQIDDDDAEWKKLMKQIAEFIYPGAKYAGVSNDHEMKPTPHKIVLEFGEYGMADGSLIYGKYYNPDAKGVETTFVLPLPVKKGDSPKLIGQKKEHFNPFNLKGVPNYYSSLSWSNTPHKIHIGFHDDNLLFYVESHYNSDYFRGELKPVAAAKTASERAEKTEKAKEE